MKRYNPWPGLASYKDPGKNGENAHYQFCGRLSETYDLLQLIENRSVVTLYGSTGIGKTSLLCAGVFPILRQRTSYHLNGEKGSSFFPIYVRLCSPSQLKKSEVSNMTYADILIKCIEQEIKVSDSKVKNSPYENETNCTLWHYFHTHHFYNDNMELLTPVIVLDQFEEVFAICKNDNKIETFLNQLYTLAEDRIPWEEYNGYHAADFRSVISLREDKFFYMENYVDTLRLSLFKENRYRLLPLKYEQAEQVITIPGEKLIDHDNMKEIAKLIIEQSRSKDRGDINTLLLSLICNQIYEKSSPTHKFTVEKVKELSPNVLKQFYSDITNSLPITERRDMEDLLVKDGRRIKVSKEEFLEKVPHGEYLLEQNEQSILHNSNQTVEVIHDQLAILMEEMKSATRLDFYRQRMKTGGWLALTFIALLLVLWFTYIIPQYIWHETIPLDGPIVNTHFKTEGTSKPFSIPSGVLNLASNVVVEHRAFQANPDIRELHLGDSCNIDYFAFQKCPNLKTVYFDGKGLLMKANAFSGCNKIESIIVSDSCDFLYIGSQDIFRGLSRVVVNGNNPNFMTFGNTLLIKHHTGAKPYWNVICSYKDTQMRRFYYANGSSSLHISGEVILPQLEDSIALDSMRVVYGTTFDISKGEDPDTISYKVLTCKSPEQGTFPKGVHNNPKVIGIDMPEIVHIPNKAFEQNERLRAANLPSVYDVGEDAFANCKALENVYIPKASIMKNRAFSGCSSLKEIQLPMIEEIGSSCFRNCDSLECVIAPSMRVINESAFAQSGLLIADFPSVEEVRQGAFQNCNRLKRIILPSVKTIDIDFYGCDSLEEIVIPTSMEHKVLDEIDNKYKFVPNRKFFELSEHKGNLSVLKSVLSPDTTYFADGDTLNLSSGHSLYCRRLVWSKHIRVIGNTGYRMLHKEVSVEHGNPKFFSFKNVVYDKDGIVFNAEGAEHVYFMNYGIGNGGKHNYQANLSYDLKSIYLHYPQKNNVRIYVEKRIPIENGTIYQNDSSFLKTITLRIPYGYKKYFENNPDYQIFKSVEELSLWETLAMNMEWKVTKEIWAHSVGKSFMSLVIVSIVLILVTLCGYVLLFMQKRLFAIGAFLVQIVSMLFIGTLLCTIDLNYANAGGNKNVVSLLLIIEILLLFTPWFFILKKRIKVETILSICKLSKK